MTLVFRERLLSGEVLLGTWLKTPSATVAEVLAGSALDVLCLDAEHAPFDRGDLDACVMACRGAGMPALVRVPLAEPAQILNALDLGAAGVVVPHVASAADAARAAKASRFGPGGRGFAGSTRSAGYTRRSMAEHVDAAAGETAVIAQIEDAEALDAIDAIAAVGGVDCLFVGRADLAVSLGAWSAADPRVIDAARTIVDAAGRAGRRTGMFIADLGETREWIDRGVTLFLLESDQTFLLRGAASLRDRFDAARR
jgi:2-keto-3-deoxy-L-rhamnonate aldolase RhmA